MGSDKSNTGDSVSWSIQGKRNDETFWKLPLPSESGTLVFSLLAVSLVFISEQRHN
jgi:hypothetical protein